MSTKKKFEMEFVIQASPQLLYQYISTASGLSEWYADNVNARSEKFTFIWDGNEEEAMLLKKKSDQYVRFQWSQSESPEEFFELRIVVDEITKDVSLFVIDFADEDEIEESKMLWDNQIDDLKHVLGSV
ncbi:MAG: START-like domain-containing protein [Flavobacteriaceae bacterium]